MSIQMDGTVVRPWPDVHGIVQWIGIGRFVLDCVPGAAMGGIEYIDAVTVLQDRGLQIPAETGITAVDRDGDLVVFGTTMETARPGGPGGRGARRSGGRG
jgi:hypothetical protein